MILMLMQMAGPVDCEQLYLKHLAEDISLNYEAFDQTPGNGFRALAKSCKNEAIELIKNYIILNRASEHSLRWHIAQLSGELGRYQEAVLYARSTYRDQEAGQFKWNDYVDGYIAYWLKDPNTLSEKIRILEAHPANQGNIINARLLRQFLVELEKPENPG
jgi:hypothetical protein